MAWDTGWSLALTDAALVAGRPLGGATTSRRGTATCRCPPGGCRGCRPTLRRPRRGASRRWRSTSSTARSGRLRTDRCGWAVMLPSTVHDLEGHRHRLVEGPGRPGVGEPDDLVAGVAVGVIPTAARAKDCWVLGACPARPRGSAAQSMTGMSMSPWNCMPARVHVCLSPPRSARRGAGVAPPSGERFMFRELHGSKFSGVRSRRTGSLGAPSRRCAPQLPTSALRSRNSAGVITPEARADRPYCTPTLFPRDLGEPVVADAVDVDHVAPVGPLDALSLSKPACRGRRRR